MVENDLSIKIKTKVDKSEAENLADFINNLNSSNVKINVDGDELEIVKEDIEDFENKKIPLDVDLNNASINDAKKLINDLDTEKVEVDIKADDGELKSAKIIITDIDGEKIDVDLNVEDTNLKNIQKEIDNLKGENIEVSVHVDDTEIKNAKKEVDDLGNNIQSGLGSTESAITGLVGAVAGNNIWDTIYGTSKKAETNKILLKNMADTGTGYQKLYDTIDNTTNQSLISMQSLIPALNGIKSATGSTATEINNVTPGVAQFGQYVLALTGSEAKAESAMFDLSKGIKGLYASLDQYGITEESLMATGLWSGKEDDVEGYIAAVNAVTGSTDELMGSTQGLEALMGKAFSRGGKKIGTELLPHIKNLLNGFIDLDSATGGWLSTTALIGGGALTGMVTFLSVMGQAIHGVKMMKDAITVLREAQLLHTAVTKVSAAAQWLLNIAMSANPIMIVVIAIIALIAVLTYLYFNNEQVRNAINALGQTFVQIGQIIYNSVIGFVNMVISSLQNLWNYITTLEGLLPANVSLTGNQIIDTILRVITFIATLPLQLSMIFMNVIAKVLGFGDNFSQKMIKSALKSVNGFMSWIGYLPSKLSTELNNMLSAVNRWASTLPQKFWEAGVNAVKNFLNALGIHSPGIMQTKLLMEMQNTGDRIPEVSKSMIRNVGIVGDDVVKSFKNPQLEIGFNVSKPSIKGLNSVNDSLINSLSVKNNESGGDVFNITLNVGHVDKKERVDEILDALKNYFLWDNTTAGRTV